MFRTGLHATLLQSQYCLICAFTSKVRICTKSFPISSTLCSVSADFYNHMNLTNLRHPTKVHHRAQNHIHSFRAMFKSHEKTALANQATVEAAECQFQAMRDCQ